MFGEINKVTNIDWEVETKGFPFVKCSELQEKTPAVVKGFFISPDNGYGEGAVAILEDKLLNLPSRYVDIVKSIISTPAMVESIKAGHCAIEVESFISKKFKKKGYDVRFLDI